MSLSIASNNYVSSTQSHINHDQCLIDVLPNEIIFLIIGNVGWVISSFQYIRLVCKRWREITNRVLIEHRNARLETVHTLFMHFQAIIFGKENRTQIEGQITDECTELFARNLLEHNVKEIKKQLDAHDKRFHVLACMSIEVFTHSKLRRNYRMVQLLFTALTTYMKDMRKIMISMNSIKQLQKSLSEMDVYTKMFVREEEWQQQLFELKTLPIAKRRYLNKSISHHVKLDGCGYIYNFLEPIRRLMESYLFCTPYESFEPLTERTMYKHL